MPPRSKERFYDRNYESYTVDDPGAEDLLVINYDKDFILTELVLDLANDGSVQVEVRDDGGGNATTVLNISETNYSDGDFEDPVAEAGSGQEIAIVSAESLTGEVNVNARVHNRRA